jgi:hypothetical protein
MEDLRRLDPDEIFGKIVTRSFKETTPRPTVTADRKATN